MTKDAYVRVRRLEPDEKVASTRVVAEGVTVDFDAGGKPLGVEVLGACMVELDGFPKWVAI